MTTGEGDIPFCASCGYQMCGLSAFSCTALSQTLHRGWGLPGMYRLCRSSDKDTLYQCALVFRKLCPIIGNHEPVVSRGGLHRSLCSAYRHRTHIEGRESPCSRGEARLAHERCEQDDPGGRGCLERAIRMGGDRDLKMRIYALGPLRHLSSESCGRYLVHV